MINYLTFLSLLFFFFRWANLKVDTTFTNLWQHWVYFGRYLVLLERQWAKEPGHQPSHHVYVRDRCWHRYTSTLYTALPALVPYLLLFCSIWFVVLPSHIETDYSAGTLGSLETIRVLQPRQYENILVCVVTAVWWLCARLMGCIVHIYIYENWENGKQYLSRYIVMVVLEWTF